MVENDTRQATPASRAAPRTWLDALDRTEADVAAGRVGEIDLDALCREIEAEADAATAERRKSTRPSAA